MKFKEQVSIVCHVILFKPKSFYLSHWGFQGQPQLKLYFQGSTQIHPTWPPTFPLSSKPFRKRILKEFISKFLPPCTAETT